MLTGEAREHLLAARAVPRAEASCRELAEKADAELAGRCSSLAAALAKALEREPEAAISDLS